MNFNKAKKLHIHSEVTVKSTGELIDLAVVDVDIITKQVTVRAMTKDGFMVLNHKEIS